MTTFNNISSELSDKVFSMTGFNYDINSQDNGDGTENITFDSEKDAEKFRFLLKEVSGEPKPNTLKVALKRITLKGQIVNWEETDPGFKKFAGSVYFENMDYFGFLRHDGNVELKRNGRNLGVYAPVK